MVEIGKPSYEDFKNVKNIKNGHRNHLQSRLKSVETLAMVERKIQQQLTEKMIIFVLFFPFYFIYYANDQNALTTKLSKNSIHVQFLSINLEIGKIAV